MGSTGEPDRKRRHLSSVSPTAVTAMAKKLPFYQPSEEKKLDKAVLQYQNQKLLQKLEVQKVEYKALENKFSQLKEKQQPHDTILRTVKKSFEKLVSDLETSSNGMRELSCWQDSRNISIPKDDCSSSHEDAFLSRLMETGATQNSALNNCLVEIKHGEIPTEQIENILCNIVAAISDLWHLKDGLHAAILKELSEDGECRQKTSAELGAEVKNLRLGFSNLHLKQKSMGRELQKCRDIDAKNKAYIKQLKGELENSVAELADSSGELATLKAERDATKGAFFPIFNVGSKPGTGDKVKDKQKDKHEMESTLRELLDQASSRLVEIRHLHDERIKMLQQSSDLQNSLKNVRCITSSQGCLLLRDRLEKSKTEISQYQALFKKLQVEKDSLVWKEKELNMKNDLGEVFRRATAVSDLRIDDLVEEIQKQVSERNIIQNKLDKASRKPGRKDIIAKFKALVSSFPEEMGSMQRQLSNFKEAASDINHLQADAQSLSCVLDMKAKENESLSTRAANQVSEMCNLQSVLRDLKAGDVELMLILEMCMSESIDSSDVLQAKNMEYKAWAQVRSLESSLDERNLELRVKTANEAEAISQQRLAAAEAEIAELRQKLESSKRELLCFSGILKSKNEENEAYLSEIETIGQAYDDMQTQNQHLLQQITERDDYNIKLIVEGLKARQLQDSLFLEKKTIEREIEQARISLDFYDLKAARIEDQLKICSDQLHKLGEDKFHYSVMLENTQKKSQDARRLLNQTKDAIEISQFRVDKGRAAFLDLQIQLETERFSKRRMEEDLEVLRRKVSYLRAQMDGSSVAEKLQQELREYREIVKCSICVERPKEVVITKCYHLFCNPCVQRIIESRHRKCPACSTTFGPNDVKPVYI